MTALVYHEPYRYSAGALAVLVHAMFFSLLYFGFDWHVKSPPDMVVEMWGQLPDPIPEVTPEVLPPPPPPPPVQEAPAKVVQPVVAPKADIELKKDKKKAAKDKKEAATLKKEEKNKPQLKPDKTVPAEPSQVEPRISQEDARIQELKAKMRAEMDAATQGEVARYKDMIQSKIRRNIANTADVPENAEAIFFVTVLPGGLVMDNVKLLKSSGNAAYDSAAERAIFKAQPLPLPQDPAVARLFRELRLSVKP